MVGMMHEWEKIDDTTARLTVPDGWCYAVLMQAMNTAIKRPAVGMCFVPRQVNQAIAERDWLAGQLAEHFTALESSSPVARNAAWWLKRAAAAMAREKEE